MVGLSKAFQHYLLPKIRAAFPAEFPADKSPEALYAAQASERYGAGRHARHCANNTAMCFC